MDRDADMIVSSTKTSCWSRLQIILHGRKKVKIYGSYLGEILVIDIDTTINLFGNPKNDLKQTKSGDSHEFSV